MFSQVKLYQIFVHYLFIRQTLIMETFIVKGRPGGVFPRGCSLSKCRIARDATEGLEKSEIVLKTKAVPICEDIKDFVAPKNIGF